MEIGDTVLHPRYGVGIIDAIEKRQEDGEIRDYYVIPKPSISSTILVPVDAAGELGLRPVASEDELNQAVSILSGEDDESNNAAGMRALCWGDPIDLARAIRSGATEPKSRYPKASQQHQLKRAKRLLSEELSVVLGLSEDNITALVDGEVALSCQA